MDLYEARQAEFKISNDWAPPAPEIGERVGNPAVDRVLKATARWLNAAERQWGAPKSVNIEHVRAAFMSESSARELDRDNQQRAKRNVKVVAEMQEKLGIEVDQAVQMSGGFNQSNGRMVNAHTAEQRLALRILKWTTSSHKRVKVPPIPGIISSQCAVSATVQSLISHLRCGQKIPLELVSLFKKRSNELAIGLRILACVSLNLISSVNRYVIGYGVRLPTSRLMPVPWNLWLGWRMSFVPGLRKSSRMVAQKSGCIRVL